MNIHDVAEQAYKNGYVKGQKDILDELETLTKNHGICYVQRIIAELKKKYIKDCTTCKNMVSCEPNTSGNFDCWEADTE